MDQPIVVIRITANIADGNGINPLTEVAVVETCINSTPAINKTLHEFVARYRKLGISLGNIQFRAVRTPPHAR